MTVIGALSSFRKRGEMSPHKVGLWVGSDNSLGRITGRTSECGELTGSALVNTSTRFIAAMCSLVRMLPLSGRGRSREVEGAEGVSTGAFHCF